MSTIKVDTIQTRNGAGNITLSNPISATTTNTTVATLLNSGSHNTTNGVLHVKQSTATNNPTMLIQQVGEGGNPNDSQGLDIRIAGQNQGNGHAIRVITTNSNLNSGNAFDAFSVTNGGVVSPYGGIDFSNFTSSDTAGQHQGTPTVTGHVLMDYEQGTWPGEFRGKSGSGTSTTATGHYTKIGRMVYIAITFNVTAPGAFSAEPQVRGLPFRAHGTHNFAVHIGHNKFTRLNASGTDTASGAFNGDYIATVTASQSFIYISGYNTVVSNWSDVQAGSYHFSGWYMTND
jgi:hypothetical protein